MGLNATLATAGRSLEVFSAGIQVAGQNIANANTPGYIREELRLEAAPVYRNGVLIFGTGVLAAGIQQQIDLYLEVRLHAANTDYRAAAARESIFKQLEAEINELGDADLSSSLNSFLGAMNDVVNQPESASARQIAIDRGEELATNISTLRHRIDELRQRQTLHVDSLVEEANALIQEIDRLNPQISKLEAAGLLKSDAGALRTQRYNALNRLSEIMPVRFNERADGGVDVFSGSDYLILEGHIQQLETIKSTDRNIGVQFVRLSETQSIISTSGGELRGIIEGRDEILGGFVDQLDTLASHLIGEFNRIHAAGEGLKGFSQVTAETRVTDTAAALNAADLAFAPRHGSFQVKVTNKLTGLTTTANIAVDLDGLGTETSLADLQGALDGLANVSASITTDGRLQITADSNFEVRFANDTSGTLASLGINTFFTGHNSDTIAVNSVVKGNHEFFATGQGGGPSDGRNAVRLADFTRSPVNGLGGLSLDEFYDSTVTNVAQSSASETALTRGYNDFRDSLSSQRQQLSGVSVDEEALRVLQFQRAFQSAARLISVIDELYTTLLQL